MVSTSFASLLAVALLSADAAAGVAPFVDPSIQAQLLQNGKVNLVVSFKKGVTDPLNAIETMSFTDRGHKLTQLVKSLQNHARDCQQSIDSVLALNAKKKNRHTKDAMVWISNDRIIRDASSELVYQLSQNADISALRQELNLPPPEIKVSAGNVAMAVTPSAVTTREWGVTKVSAPSVWGLGVTGQSVH